MPYFITDSSEDCSGWATIKEDGEVIGCHDTKQAAIAQMVAVSLAENIPVGGERKAKKKMKYERAAADALDVGDYVSWNSSGGRARGDIRRILRSGTLNVPDSDFTISATEDDPAALIRVWRPVEGGWRATDRLVGHRFSTLTKIDPLPEPDEDRVLPDNYRPALSEDVPEGRACGNCYFYNEAKQITEDGTRKAYCERWEDYVDGGFYCNAWQAKPAQARQVDLSVPDYIRDNAEQGLRWHREGLSGDGLVERTVREAAAMARGDVTEDKVRRMAAWFARHMSDLAAPSARPSHPDYPSPGVVAHALWGGGSRVESERAMAWAEAKVKALDSEERNAMTPKLGGLVTSDVETRDLPMTMANFEFRDDSDYMSFRGYAAVFNSESEPLPFRETIMPGAFSRSLRSRNNVKMFVNHNMDQVLASSRAGTLKLSEDNRGLLVEADLPPTTYAKDLSIMMRRGDVDSMSFGFSVPRNGDTWNEERTERTLREVRLHEVSIVTSFPAYAATTAQVRTIDILAKRAGCEVDSIADAIRSIENGSELSAEQREVIAGLVDALTLKSATAEQPSQKLNMLRTKLDHAYKAI